MLTPGRFQCDFDGNMRGEDLAADAGPGLGYTSYGGGPPTDNDGRATFSGLIPGATYRLLTTEGGNISIDSKVLKDFQVTANARNLELPRALTIGRMNDQANWMGRQTRFVGISTRKACSDRSSVAGMTSTSAAAQKRTSSGSLLQNLRPLLAHLSSSKRHRATMLHECSIVSASPFHYPRMGCARCCTLGSSRPTSSEWAAEAV